MATFNNPTYAALTTINSTTYLMVCDTDNHCLRWATTNESGGVNGSWGTFVGKLGVPGGKNGYLNKPTGFYLSSASRTINNETGYSYYINIIDSGNHCIRAYTYAVGGVTYRAPSAVGTWFLVAGKIGKPGGEN